MKESNNIGLHFRLEEEFLRVVVVVVVVWFSRD